MVGSDETTEELLHSTGGELIEMLNQKLVNVVTELCWLNVQKVDVQQKVTQLCPAFACDSTYILYLVLSLNFGFGFESILLFFSCTLTLYNLTA